jgi:hypothetical protein
MAEEPERPDDVSEETDEPHAPPETAAAPEDVAAHAVTLERCRTRSVNGVEVSMSQSAARTVTGDTLTLRQAAALELRAETVDAEQVAVVVARGGRTTLRSSQAGLVLCEDEARLEQSAAGAVLAARPLTLDRSVVGLVAGRHVRAERSAALVLLAGHVEGEVRASLGPREALLFGAAAGFVGGLLTWLMRRR